MSARRGGGGRPRLPRGITDLASDAWKPPAAIVLDTSAVVELLQPSQRAHRHWSQFFTTCVEHDTSLIFNRLVETELYDALFNIALRERWGKGGAHGPKRYDGRARARAARLLDLYSQEWQALLDTANTVTIEVGEVANQVPELMRQCGMRSHDAVHAATAILTETPLIATTDSGFATLPESTLQIVTDPHRVTQMRRRRAHWANRSRS